MLPVRIASSGKRTFVQSRGSPSYVLLQRLYWTEEADDLPQPTIRRQFAEVNSLISTFSVGGNELPREPNHPMVQISVARRDALSARKLLEMRSDPID